jgi:hypothetical protein
VGDRWLIRFGFSSSFRIYCQRWPLVITEGAQIAQQGSAAAAAVKRAEEAAAAVGLPVVDDAVRAGTRIVCTQRSTVADASIVLALMRRDPVVHLSW